MRIKLLKKAALCMLSSACLLCQSTVSFADTGGTWKYERGYWNYYNTAGEKSAGWVLNKGNWYYFDTVTKAMKTGWHKDTDGTWYFLSTAEGAELGKMLTGWTWVDGYCYYFKEDAPNRGSLYVDAQTPDGYRVDKEGRWFEKGEEPVYRVGKGLRSKPLTDEKKEAKKSGAGGAGRTYRSGGGSGSGGGSRSGGFERGRKQGEAGALPKNQEENASEDTGVFEKEGNTPESTDHGKPDMEEGGSGGSGTDAGGSGGNDFPGNGGQAEGERLLHASETGIISREIGWAKYVAISFKSGSVEDYDVFIDGTDIGPALTRVDSAGKIVKWMSTVKDPKELRVVRKSDNKEESLALGEGPAESRPDAGNPEDSPRYVFTNGPISRFDYLLDNYDSTGTVRSVPARTTFDLDAVSVQDDAEGSIPGKYYSPDTLIDDTGKGSLVMKLSLANDAQIRWFEGLGRIRALNDENRPVNDNILFIKRIENTYGKTGVIEVALPQTNFFNRGRYSFVLYSTSDKALTIPVHLVDKNRFELLLNASTPSPRTGDKIMFHIVGADTSIDPTFGNDLKNPIRRVVLVKPSGQELELEKIKHWALIGNVFNIYGSDPEKKEILTDIPGIYTIRIYADGYQSMEKKIDIAQGDGEAGTGAKSFTALYSFSSASGVDALSSASGSIGGGNTGGGSSGGGSGGSINGYYLFDHDLLVNANILNDIRPGDPEVKAVMERYFSHVPVMAGDSLSELYDFDRYLGAVRDKRSEGQEMSFAEYLAADGKKLAKTKPREYRYVLEDGLLGALQKLSELSGKDFPAFEGRTAKKGENFILSTGETEYISSIKALYMDGNSSALRNDAYLKQFEISAAGDAITIYPSAFNQYNTKLVGEHTLRIEAEGYKTNYLKLTITKDYEEFELRLADNPMKAEGDEPTRYYTSQDVHIHAAAEEESPLYGDFLKSLSEVRLDTPDAAQLRVSSEGEGGLFTGDNYKKSGGELILQSGLFKKEGRYTVYLVSGEGYVNKTLSFEIFKPVQPEEEGEGETELQAAPRFLEAEYKTNFWDKYWLVKFEAENAKAIEDYFKTAVNKVTVNETVYAKTAYGDGNHYTFGEIGAYGTLPYLKLYDKSFVRGQNRIRIEAEGYEVLEFTIVNGSEATPPPGSEEPDQGGEAGEGEAGNDGLLAAPNVKEVVLLKKMFFGSFYVVVFQDMEDREIQKYLESNKVKITVNETVFSRQYFLDEHTRDAYRITNEDEKGMNSGGGAYKYLVFPAGSLEEGQNKVKIEHEGYRPLEFHFDKTS